MQMFQGRARTGVVIVAALMAVLATSVPSQAASRTTRHVVRPWFSNTAVLRPVSADVEVFTPAPFSSSPYVCTPSGFGQKARCFLRNRPKSL